MSQFVSQFVTLPKPKVLMAKSHCDSQSWSAPIFSAEIDITKRLSHLQNNMFIHLTLRWIPNYSVAIISLAILYNRKDI